MRRGVIGSVVTTLGVGATLVACASATRAPAPDLPGADGRAGAVEPLAIGPSATLPPGGPSEDGTTSLSIGQGAVDTTGGSIPDGQTASPFDEKNPVIAFLDPLLRKAIQDAATDAAAAGIDVRLTSGWRSKGFQQRLFDQAVTTYGSVDAARQFVASPEVSKHVLGEAVDVGPTAADDWMIRNGMRFGLCQIYANEIWHFELAVDAQGACPPLRPNAAG
jgi:hypothetical protein